MSISIEEISKQEYCDILEEEDITSEVDAGSLSAKVLAGASKKVVLVDSPGEMCLKISFN